ncbi:hypothetical protein [uncultured Desulfobacter sp.]|uniref:hypothetical protein n=1 Tax=uncultured Desulfobacter sp. TaxID=240139 RepID=UPI0029F4CE6A|nr:hypothetical protein [uncultured Desulfobacter sp.]
MINANYRRWSPPLSGAVHGRKTKWFHRLKIRLISASRSNSPSAILTAVRVNATIGAAKR